MIAALVITDGRVNVLKLTVASCLAKVSPVFDELFMYDDSGNEGTRELLRQRYPQFTLLTHPSGERQGFAGAIRAAWAGLREHCSADYIFHLEDDFTFNRPVDLRDFVAILDKRPRLAQLALLRQPWNAEEKAVGGVIRLHPDWYVGHVDADGRRWLEQDHFFTTNPSLYRRSLLDRYDWPEGDHSEGVFSQRLVADGWSFGYHGAIDQHPAVHHIGRHRYGVGY